jgi:stage II sporulation protein D
VERPGTGAAMSIKRKLILMGICVGIILVILTINVVRKINDDKSENANDNTIVEDAITRAEAYRLLSYLEYNKAEREALPLGITYADTSMSGDYDTYVNAVWKMSLIDGNVTNSPNEALTMGSCKELIDKLISIYPEYQQVYSDLTFDFTKPEAMMRIPEFLELYKAILTLTPEEKKQVREETLFILGTEITSDGKNRIVSDKGRFYYLDAKDYTEYFSQAENQPSMDNAADNSKQAENSDKKDLDKSNTANQTDVSAVNTDSEEADQTDKVKDKDAQTTHTNFADQYLDKGIKILVCDQEIIYVTAVTTDAIVIHNVWIKQGKEKQLDTFINGLDKSFTTISNLKSPIEKVIGDITIQNQKIVKLNVKPDMIQGKVLRFGKDFIEVKGYGKVPLEEDYKIYKIYGELTVEPTGSILVGYDNTNFIVSEGKISAALITESIKAENIRVLLQTTGYKDIYHQQVALTSDSDFTISNDKIEKSYKAGEKVTIQPGDDFLSGGRVTVKSNLEDARIQLLSVERSCGNPKYRGSIEIDEGDNGLLVINELPLEEYLYSVIPSEMPTSYGMEALKVQAVCARSYAYRHLLANSLSEYGAHVDDSVSYQVYNNVAENEDSILAVKDTYGKVVEYDGQVIIAYYFSTSCGHTTEASSVWANDVEMPYLSGKLMLAEGEGSDAQNEAADEYEDLSSEESFRSFLDNKNVTTYDSGFCWYRWKVQMDAADIKKVIDSKIADRYRANPELIQTMKSEAKDGKEAEFESVPVDTVGNIKDITVLKRESSGIISEILITGSEKTVKVRTEYNIRALLAPKYDTLVRQDSSEVDNLNMLPSAFFTIDKKEKNNQLNSIVIIGGGYGHGVGMSQNAVKALADSGKRYEDIVEYFYEGTTVGFIYE